MELQYAQPNKPPARIPQYNVPDDSKTTIDLLGNHLIQTPEIANTFDNKVFNYGRLAGPIQIIDLIIWLVETSKSLGSNNAIERLIKYLSLSHNPAHRNIAISGVTVSKKIVIDSEISIEPLEKATSKTAKFVASPKEIINPGITGGTITADEKHAKSVIRQSIGIPKLHQSGSDFIPIQCTELECIRVILNLLDDVSVLAFHQWIELEPWVPKRTPHHIEIAGGEPELKYVKLADIDQDHWNSIANYYQALIRTSGTTQSRLIAALNRLGQSKIRRSITDRAVDLGIALESILVERNESQITQKFASRASWLLTNRSSSQLPEFKLFKQIYHCRSDAVHQGHVAETYRLGNGDRVDTSHFLGVATIAAQNLIKKILSRGGSLNHQRIPIVRGRS